MTTNVKVEAHCDPEATMVKVSKTGYPDKYLTDGQSTEETVHDMHLVRVQEIPLDPKCLPETEGQASEDSGSED